MRKVMEGCQAIAETAARCRPQVIAAYPITPQTHIAERLAELTSSGSLPARFIMVESEHSALACCIGASSTGARTFTATSSHGLAYMHELLHWASGARLPIVMVNVNRALGPPWNIWADQTDSLSQRDTGWLQFYCESSQEAVDKLILAYKIAEQVQLPVMINIEAFIVSHMNEPVDLPEQIQIDRFLPPLNLPFKLDVTNPVSFGLMKGPDRYMELRFELHQAMTQALTIASQASREFEQVFGRTQSFLENYRDQEADTVLVVAGALSGIGQEAVDLLWEKGKRVGLVNLKMLRPLPESELQRILGHRKTIVVLDRNLSPGMGGIFAQEIRAALKQETGGPVIYRAIAGLGGRDVTEDDICQLMEKALEKELKEDQIEWIKVRPH